MKKEENGPVHQAQIQNHKIEGVRLQKSPIVKYKAGIICEVKNLRWENLYEDSLHHMYIIYDDTFVKREWGMHKETTDRYLLIKGSIEVALLDVRNSGKVDPIVCRLSGGDISCDKNRIFLFF